MEVSEGISCSLYVDDFSIYVSGARLADVERQLQKVIDRIVKWADSHGFKFSASKTKAVLFHNKRKMVGVPSLNLYGELIPSTDNVRFLGLVFDRRLTWANHIRGLKESCKKPLEILKKLSRVTFGADRAILHRVSTSMVQSKLDYGCHIYRSASDSLLHELESVRNKALRLEIGTFYTSNADSLHAESNVIPLHFHREFVAAKSLLHIPLSPGSPLMSLYNQALIPDEFVAAKSLLHIPLSPGSPLMSLYNQALIPDDS